MSYLVLARKYRPQRFADVIGQEHVTRTLANAFAQGRVHHAFLFCGPRGVGKTTLARILGKALNCERGPSAEPCGQCSACASISDGSAIDYFEMDGASNRGIDAIRELTEAVRYQPAALRRKVYVIDEVHMLTTEAFNALLKTLEEPPPHVAFVLATTEPHKVPSTILSRCQRYDFKLVSPAQLSAHLASILTREGIAAEEGGLDLVVRESGGSVRDALSLCDQVISFVGDQPLAEADVARVLGLADRALTNGLVAALAGGDAATALELVQSAAERGVSEEQIARAVVRYLRDLAAFHIAPQVERLVSGTADERRELAALARSLDRPRIVQMFERMLRACDDLARIPEPRLVLDVALIDAAAMEPVVPLGGLIERLQALEGRLAAAGGGGAGTPGAARGGRESKSGKALPSSPSPAAGAAASPPVSSVGSGAANNGVSRGAAPAEEWDAVVGDLEGAGHVTLAGIYQHARLLCWSQGRVEVGLAGDHFAAELAGDADNVAAMREFLTRRSGRTVEFAVLPLAGNPDDQPAGAAASTLDRERARATEERRRLEAEAREHPVTKIVLEAFGASIKEVKTDV